MFLGRTIYNRMILMDKAGDPPAGGGSGAGNNNPPSGGQPGSGASGGANGGAGGTPPTPPAGANGGGATDPLFGANGDPGAGGGGRGQGGGGGTGSNDPGQQGGNGPQKPILPDNWKDALPDDLKADPALGPIKDISGLTKSFLNAQKMIGADKVPIPGKHATAEEWKETFHKLGVPRTLEEYKVDIDPEAAKGMDPEFTGEFTKKAHEFGILPRQAKALADWFGKLNQDVWSKNEEAHNGEIKAGLDKLKKDWGQDFDGGMVRAKAAAQEFMTKDEQKWVQESGLSQNANFLRILEKVGKTLAEDKVRKHTGASNLPGSFSPGQAQQRIAEIMAQVASMGAGKHPLYNTSHENHAKVKKEMDDLYLQAYPQNKT